MLFSVITETLQSLSSQGQMIHPKALWETSVTIRSPTHELRPVETVLTVAATNMDPPLCLLPVHCAARSDVD